MFTFAEMPSTLTNFLFEQGKIVQFKFAIFNICIINRQG